MRTLIVIPARLESTRLPRKLLLAETGMPLFCHTAISAYHCHRAKEGFAIATDSADIALFTAKTFGWPAIRTGEHPNGTSRIAEVAERPAFDCYDAFCIVQADEPEIDQRLIDEVVQQLEQHPEWDCATAACPYGDANPMNRNVVSVIVGCGYSAEDFRRGNDLLESAATANAVVRHIGIYAYRREALLRYAAAGPCQREQDESLEQLRALHIGLRMGVVLTDHQSHGIDTREDYDAFVERWKRAKKP